MLPSQPPGPALSETGERAHVGLKVMAGVYLLFLAVYLLGASGHFYSTEHVAVYLEAQSIVDDHDLSITPINDAHKGHGGASP